jgi:hypothetical protein
MAWRYVPARGDVIRPVLCSYAPELNPVEYIWGYWKHHELPNFCPKTFTELSYHAIRALKRMRCRPNLSWLFRNKQKCFAL